MGAMGVMGTAVVVMLRLPGFEQEASVVGEGDTVVLLGLPWSCYDRAAMIVRLMSYISL